jgi:multiple sugar transport system substrate-binding protein
MKKFVLVVLVTLIGASTVFARGSQADAGKVTLNFMEVMTSPARTEVLRGIIAEYEKQHPDVKINLISPPYEQADSRLTMSLSANEPLDIVEVRDITASQHITNKKLEDLTPYLEKWSEGKTLLPTALEGAKAAGGRPYHIPQFFYIPALFVRTDVLAKLGVTQLPATLEELFAICAQITNPSANQYGFTLRGKGNAFRQSDLLILSNIKDIDTNSFYKMKDGSSVFTNAEFIANFQRFVDLYKNGVPSDGVNWGFNEQINSFVSGVTPFLMQDPDAVPLIDEQLSRDQYTVIPMPVGSSGSFYYEPGFGGFGITSYSKNKDAAWDFIAFVSSSAQNAEFCKKYGALPVHSSTFQNDTYFNSGVYQAWATMMADTQKYVTVHYAYTSEKYPGWSQVFEQHFQSALLGNTTVQQAAQAWADYWK